MLIDIIKPDFKYNDERGVLIQLIRKGYTQVNIIMSKANVSRGGHYHKLNTEAYYIIQGKCEVIARRGEESEQIIFTEGDFFRIGPYITHNFNYLEDSILVTMYSLGVELDNGTMDSYVYED